MASCKSLLQILPLCVLMSGTRRSNYQGEYCCLCCRQMMEGAIGATKCWILPLLKAMSTLTKF